MNKPSSPAGLKPPPRVDTKRKLKVPGHASSTKKTNRVSKKKSSPDGLVEDCLELDALELNTEVEMGALPSGDVGSEPYSSPDSHAVNQQYAKPPKNWKTGRYDPRLKNIQQKWIETENEMKKVDTKPGVTVHFVTPWLPWIASLGPGFILLLLELRYCPITVWNFCGDGMGGFMSPMGAMFANGELRSATWRLLQLILGPYYWTCMKMNSTCIVIKYKGSVHDYYTPENYKLIQAIYAEFQEFVWSQCDKVVFCSRGVLGELRTTFGATRYAEIINNLVTAGKVFSLPLRKKSLYKLIILTVFHPEAFLNIVYRRNNYEAICNMLDSLYTQVLVCLTGSKDARCTVGRDLFNEVKDSPAFKLMQQACREALLRAQKIVKDASASRKGDTSITLTQSHLNVLKNWDRRADDAMKRHHKTIVKLRKIESNWITVRDATTSTDVPTFFIPSSESTLYQYILGLRDLKEGDPTYWKKIFFADVIDFTRIAQAYNQKLTNEAKVLQSYEGYEGQRRRTKISWKKPRRT